MNEKSSFELIPDFNETVSLIKEDDGILFKFGSIKCDWEQDAKRLAWRVTFMMIGTNNANIMLYPKVILITVLICTLKQ